MGIQKTKKTELPNNKALESTFAFDFANGRCYSYDMFSNRVRVTSKRIFFNPETEEYKDVIEAKAVYKPDLSNDENAMILATLGFLIKCHRQESNVARECGELQRKLDESNRKVEEYVKQIRSYKESINKLKNKNKALKSELDVANKLNSDLTTSTLQMLANDELED